MQRIKNHTNRQPKKPNHTKPKKKKSLPQKLTHISLENTFHALNFFIFISAVTTHPVSHIQMASGFQTDIPLLPCASPSKAISSFSASSLPASVVPGYNSLLPGVLLQFPSCPA